PVDRLGHTRRLQEPPSPQRLEKARNLLGEALPRFRDAGPDDPDLLLETRVLDVEIEAAPPERVPDLARTIRSQDHVWHVLGAERPELRDRDLEIGEHLEQERLESVVGAVDLVHEKHRRSLPPGDRSEERSLEQIAARVDDFLDVRRRPSLRL